MNPNGQRSFSKNVKKIGIEKNPIVKSAIASDNKK